MPKLTFPPAVSKGSSFSVLACTCCLSIPDDSHSNWGDGLSKQLGHFYANTQRFQLVSVGSFSVLNNKKGFFQAIASLRTRSHIKILFSSLATVMIHLVTLVGSRSSWRAALHSSGCICEDVSREISKGGELCPVCARQWSVGHRPWSDTDWRGSSWLKHPVCLCLLPGNRWTALLPSPAPCHDTLPNHEPKVTEPTDPGLKSPTVNSPTKALHFIVDSVT